MHLRKLVPLADLLEGKTGPVPPSPARGQSRPVATAQPATPSRAPSRRPTRKAATAEPAALSEPSSTTGDADVTKAAILGEIKRTKKFFYGTVVAQAQQITLTGDRLVFAFTDGQRTLAGQLQQNRAWLEATAAKVIGRTLKVVAEHQNGQGWTESKSEPPVNTDKKTDHAEELRARALNDSVIQAMLDVFPAEIEDVEKL